MRAAPLALLFLLLTSCGNASPPAEPTASAPPPPSASASAAPAAPKEDKAAQVEALTASEAKSGTCDAGSQAALEKLLADVEKNAGLTTVGKRTLALGAGAKSIEMTVTGKGTEVHVLAYGAKEVSLDVLVGTAAATTMRSPLSRTIPLSLDLPKIGNVTDVQADSRQIQIKPGSPLTIKLTGQGCVGLLTLVKN